MSERAMQELHKRKLLKGVHNCKLEFCKYCTMGKQSKVTFKLQDKEKRSTGVLDYIHSDVWGPAPVKLLDGARYYVTFLDDFSRKVWVYFMKEKSDVFTKFKVWKAEVENLTGRKIKVLRSDNGGEYKDSKFLEFCKSEGIKRHFTVKKTPQQNGAAERMNRTLMECERCMRIHAGLPEAFWAEAVNHASYLVNRSPSKYLDFNCAEEVWSNKSIEYSILKVFGCSAYALIPSDERTKLKPKSLECIFLGFESGVKGFKLWDPVNRKKILSRDVVFDEKTMPIIKVKKPEVKENVVGIETTVTESSSRVFEGTPSLQPIGDVHEAVESDTEVGEFGQQQQTQDEEEEEAQDQVEPPSIARSRPKRTIKPPQRFGWETDAVHYALNISEGDPTTFQEAVESAERES
ncbi:hypothetical protein CerSpe_108340 [Prunus speciosa]